MLGSEVGSGGRGAITVTKINYSDSCPMSVSTVSLIPMVVYLLSN